MRSQNPNNTKPHAADWDQKLRLFRALLGIVGTNNKMLVSKVLSGTKFSHRVGPMSDRLRKWTTGLPGDDDSQFFIEALAAKLPTKDTVDSNLLITLTIQQYVDRLPDDDQISAKVAAAGFVRSDSAKERDSRRDDPDPDPEPYQSFRDEGDQFTILATDRGPVETIKTELRKGTIDQRHYYVGPDSARAWSALVRGDTYPTYGECKTGLGDLVKSSQWREELKNSQPSTVVMLAGGGAPTKDILFVESLLREPHVTGRVDLFLVDISYFMMEDSRRIVREHAANEGYQDRVKVVPIRDDILKLPAQKAALFHRQGSVIFTITGGTIGNLSEAAFFRSLNRVARPGDLLVVSADTIDDLSIEEERALIDKYNNADLHGFLRLVVSQVLSAANVKEFVDEALGRIKVKLADSANANPSDVPRSRTIVVTLEIAGSHLRLVTSTRYESAEMQAFAEKCGWSYVCGIPSPLNKRFKQFLFRRNSLESAGK
jgi:hypothetical protein